MRKVVLRLLNKPAFGAAAENLGQPHGHLRRYAASSVHQLRERGARDAKGGGGVRDAQAQRLNALTEYKASGVGWILHRHDLVSSSVVIDVIDIKGVTVGKAENDTPVLRELLPPKSPSLDL
jgi:hypothetical protein